MNEQVSKSIMGRWGMSVNIRTKLLKLFFLFQVWGYFKSLQETNGETDSDYPDKMAANW